MLNLIRTWNAWYSLSMQSARLAWDAQGVMALRFMQMARESTRGRQSETHRPKQIAALTEAQSGGRPLPFMSSHRVVKKAALTKRVFVAISKDSGANWGPVSHSKRVADVEPREITMSILGDIVSRIFRHSASPTSAAP